MIIDESIIDGNFIKSIECLAKDNKIIRECCWIRMKDIRKIISEGATATRFFTCNEKYYYIALIPVQEIIGKLNQ